MMFSLRGVRTAFNLLSPLPEGARTMVPASNSGWETSAPMGSSRDRRLDQGESFLEGKLLIALPGMVDDRFAQTVIYMCAHSAKGAMGIVINKPIPGLSFAEVLKQLEIETKPSMGSFPILYGGPVETGRGFVLHSGDYDGSDSTLPVSEDFSLTATLDILRAIAEC